MKDLCRMKGYLVSIVMLIGCCSTGKTEIIDGVVINNEQDGLKLAKYANYSDIQLEKPTIPTLSIEILERLKNLVKLEAYSGQVKVLHISPQLETVHFYNTGTSEVVIAPTSVFELKKLSLTYVDLTALPKYLGKLRQLEYLDLDSCKLQHVNTDDLNGLRMLEVLDLRNNKITKIGSSQNMPVNLPSLQKLFLHSNLLTSINFDHWNAASLERIDLNNNNLSMALSLLSAFPELHEVDLSGNLLNCPWKDYVFSELKARNAIIHNGEATECNEAARSSDIQWYDNFLVIKTLDKEKASKKQVRELEKTVIKTVVSIDAVKRELQAGMIIPLEKIRQQQYVIEDLTEILYQHVQSESDELPNTVTVRDDRRDLQRVEQLESVIKTMKANEARLLKRVSQIESFLSRKYPTEVKPDESSNEIQNS